MKKRVFLNLDNAVFRVLIVTEDWSQGDIELMAQYGEPEINVGGEVSYLYKNEQKSKTFGDEYVRVLHCFPYVKSFDSRDYDSVEEARIIGNAWKDMVLERINYAVHDLRENNAQLPTEEVSEI